MKSWLRRRIGRWITAESGDPVAPYRKRYQAQFDATGMRSVMAPALFRTLQLVTSGIVSVLCEPGPFGTQVIGEDGMPVTTTRARRVRRMLTYRMGSRDAHNWWLDVAMEYCIRGNGILLPIWTSDGLTGLRFLDGVGGRVDDDGLYVLRDESGAYGRYAPEELIHLRFTGEMRGGRARRGFAPSPVMMVSQAMAVHLGLEGFVLDWFEQAQSGGGAKNSMAIVLGEDAMTAGTEGAFLDSIRAHADGRGPLVLPPGSKVVPLTPKPSDSQIEELKRFTVVELGRAYGVPPALLGETSGSPIYGAGVEAISTGFREFTVAHHLDNFQRPIQSRLLPFGQTIWMTERSFRAADTEGQAKLATTLLGPNGSLDVSRSAVLRTLGLPPWIPAAGSQTSGVPNDAG